MYDKLSPIAVIFTFGWELSMLDVTIKVSRGQESSAPTPLILQPRRHYKVGHFTASAMSKLFKFMPFKIKRGPNLMHWAK